MYHGITMFETWAVPVVSATKHTHPVSTVPAGHLRPPLSRRNVANSAGVCGEEKKWCGEENKWCGEEKLYFGATVRRVGFKVLAPGTQTTHISFVMLVGPLISNLAPNSKKVK